MTMIGKAACLRGTFLHSNGEIQTVNREVSKYRVCLMGPSAMERSEAGKRRREMGASGC